MSFLRMSTIRSHAPVETGCPTALGQPVVQLPWTQNSSAGRSTLPPCSSSLAPEDVLTPFCSIFSDLITNHGWQNPRIPTLL